MRVGIAILSLLAVAFAGCADSGAETTDSTEPTFDDFEAEATATTGIIRGVVLTATVQPIQGALVKVMGTPLNATTNAEGAFALGGIDPGTYFLEVSKVGFNTTQASALVEANVPKPAIVKIVLPADPSSLPYYTALQFDGFIQCSVRGMVIGFAVCATYGGLDDDFSRSYQADKTPQWVQSELTWESTQTAGDELSLSISCLSGPGCPNGQETIDRSEGHSPRMIQFNETLAKQYMIGEGEPISLRVFAHGMSELDPPEEDVYNILGFCVPWPVLFAECIRSTGPGVVIDQPFTAYTYIFYGFTPEEDWWFLNDGTPKTPSS